jgi:hypothetical protein
MNIQNVIEKWELEIAKVTPDEEDVGKWYENEWSSGRYGAISEFLKDIKQLNLPRVSVSFDDEIDAELERRSIVQYMDDDDEPHWDEGKLYWARKMFRDGAKWVNER